MEQQLYTFDNSGSFSNTTALDSITFEVDTLSVSGQANLSNFAIVPSA